jgi:hypothetical protein
MTDAPKNIVTWESSTRLDDWSKQWKEFKKKRDYVTWSNDRATSKATHGRKELFAALDKYVTTHGGWTVSIPGAREIKIEVPKGSDLPGKLQALGWKPILCGTTMRTTGKGLSPSIF